MVVMVSLDAGSINSLVPCIISLLQTSPEAVAEYDAKRALHIEKLLEEHGRKLQDHKSGRRLLDDEEHRKLLRQVDAFQRKLTQINGATDKDRMERLLEVREHQNELRVDYLDFDKPDF